MKQTENYEQLLERFTKRIVQIKAQEQIDNAVIPNLPANPTNEE